MNKRKVQKKLVENWWIWTKIWASCSSEEATKHRWSWKIWRPWHSNFTGYACELFVNLTWTPLLPLLLPVLHLSLCVPVVFWRRNLFTAQSGRNPIVTYGMKFFIYTLQTLCRFSLNLGKSQKRDCSWDNMPPKNANIYLPESLSSLWWFVPFLMKLILSFKISFSFDLIIFMKCHEFLCCISTVKWV